MGKRKGVESSIAVADSAAMCRVDAIAAYPITPQTHIVEHLAEWVNDGHLDAEYLPAESEHSAISAAMGMSAVGARTFTATASQGLALMHEILFIVPAMRFPIVMAVTNRSLSGPISIWNDHSDIMVERDIGWIQIFAENGQESFDLVPACFRIAEDKRVHLPAILNFDGFVVSHMIEPIEFWTQEQFDAYLPPFDPQIRLDVRKPVAMGVVGIPEIYYETRRAQQEVLMNAKSVVLEAFDELEKLVGRKYNLVETYKTDDAEVVLYMMGSLSETAMTAVDNLRAQGIRTGLVRPRLWRPFPAEEIAAELVKFPVVGVCDRALAFGLTHHPVAQEIRTTLYDVPNRPQICEFVIGLGGRDVTIPDFENMLRRLLDIKNGAPVGPVEYVGVRQ